MDKDKKKQKIAPRELPSFDGVVVAIDQCRSMDTVQELVCAREGVCAMRSE
jgi:hypothetical protein